MAKIHYARVDELWRKEEKYAYLDEKQHRGNVEWQKMEPDEKHNWLVAGLHGDFHTLLPLLGRAQGVFEVMSNGVQTNRDVWVYNFQKQVLVANV